MTGLPVAPQRFSVTIIDSHSVVFSWDVVSSAIVSDIPSPVVVTYYFTVI